MKKLLPDKESRLQKVDRAINEGKAAITARALGADRVDEAAEDAEDAGAAAATTPPPSVSVVIKRTVQEEVTELRCTEHKTTRGVEERTTTSYEQKPSTGGAASAAASPSSVRASTRKRKTRADEDTAGDEGRRKGTKKGAARTEPFTYDETMDALERIKPVSRCLLCVCTATCLVRLSFSWPGSGQHFALPIFDFRNFEHCSHPWDAMP